MAFGGPRFFTNEQLGRVDNAFVAASVLAPEPGLARITVLAPSVVDLRRPVSRRPGCDPGTQRDSDAARSISGFMRFHRMRRLGAVVREPQPVPIRGSELVLQAGVLSERSKDPASAAATIREDFIRRWRRTLAIEHDDPARLADQLAVAQPTSTATATLDALTRPVATDVDLLEIVRALDAIDHPPTNDVNDVGSDPISFTTSPSDKPDHREVSTHV